MVNKKIVNITKINSIEINKMVAKMRPDLKISTAEFRCLCEKIFNILLATYFKNFKGNKNHIGLTIVLRAASAGFLAMKNRLLQYNMPVFLIWVSRDEITIKASTLNCNLPQKVSSNMPALILETMCATATSVDETMKQLLKRGFKEKNITFICAIASPEGLNFLRDNYPQLKVITGFTGSHIGLNEKKYIIYLDNKKMVVGDAGDRWMGIPFKGKLLKNEYKK